MPQNSTDTNRDIGMLVGRVLMSLIFIWAGYGKLIAPAATIAFFAKDGLPLPQVGWVIAVIVEFGGGIALLLGLQARLVGAVLAAWCIATALIGHSDFSDRNMQIHFMKNVAMAGGYLYVAFFGAGRYTIRHLFGTRSEIRDHA